MLLKWLIYASVLSFTPDYVLPQPSKDRRSDNIIPCNEGWFQFRDKCYKLGSRKRSDRIGWKKASERCNTLGGHLASILSKEEQDFITTFLMLDIKYSLWIGLHDQVNESTYVWDDGSPVDYTNWRPLEPSGPDRDNEDCVQMIFEPHIDSVGFWNDNDCDHLLPFVCQMKTDRRSRSPDPRYCSSEEGGGFRFQTSCYHIITEIKSWENAEQHCIDNFNGHLVTILDRVVDYFLDYILSNSYNDVWIGIKLVDQFQQKWSSGWYVGYDGFSKDHHHHQDFIAGTCVVRAKRNVWTIVPCSKKYSFVCEVSKANPPVLKAPIKGSYCPEIPEDWRDLDGNFCYFFETKQYVNWFKASYECMRRGGNLLSIHSDEETEILAPFIKYTQYKVYIGLLRHAGKEDLFVWSDGSQFDYENWSHDEPNNENEKCGEVWTSDLSWNDANCDENKGYICSVKKIEPNETKTKDMIECPGAISFKALIGVSVCIILIIILLGVVIYYFRPWNVGPRKHSAVLGLQQSSPDANRLKYRSELTVKEEDTHYDPDFDPNYEAMN